MVSYLFWTLHIKSSAKLLPQVHYFVFSTAVCKFSYFTASYCCPGECESASIGILTCIFLVAKEVDHFSYVYKSFGHFLHRSIYRLFILKTCYSFCCCCWVTEAIELSNVILTPILIITFIRFKTLNVLQCQSPCLMLHSWSLLCRMKILSNCIWLIYSTSFLGPHNS